MAAGRPALPAVAGLAGTLVEKLRQRREMDMPTGTVTAIGQSSTGKPQVTIDGTKYSAGKTNIQGMQVGDKISYDSNSSNFNGRDIWFLNSWKLLEGASKYPLPNQQATSLPPPAASNRPVGAGSPVLDVERPAISNWVAAAIASGAIKTPADILQWVTDAKHALRVDTSFGTDKDIPY